MNKRLIILLVLAGVFVIAAGFIIYNGRPVMKLNQEVITTSTTGTNIQTNTENPTKDKQNTTSTEVKGNANVVVESVATAPVPTTTPTPTQAPGTYTMAQVQTHNTVSNCWTTIGGGVYDLTTWVSRHPGGENPIMKLCGIDGTANFQRKHGSNKTAQNALFLLKIGTLAN